MLPRQRMPFPGGMPRMHPMQGAPRFIPMGRSPQMRQGGGLLARILGKGNNSYGMTGFNNASQGILGSRSAGAGAGSFLKSLSNPSSISGFLTNTQKFLNTAGQIAPMIQQYSPMVRNLPVMWKLYKGFKDLPSSEETKNDDSNESIEKKTNVKNNTKDNENQDTKLANKEKGISKPKLYI